MKTALLILILKLIRLSNYLFIFLILLSCQKEKPSKRKSTKTIISGISLDKTQKKEYVLHSQLGYEKISLDSNGFDCKFHNVSSGIVELILDYNIKFPIYISPGDSIALKYREKDLINNFDKIDFSGTKCKENKTLLGIKKNLKYESTNNYSFFNCSEKEFLNKIDSIERIAIKILNDYNLENTKVDKKFIKSAESYIHLQIANYLEAYPSILKNAFGKKYAKLDDNHIHKNQSADIIHLSDLYLSKNKSFRDYNPDHLNNAAFTNYILDIVYKNTSDHFNRSEYNRKGNLVPDIDLYLTVVDSLFTNKEIIDFLKYRILLQQINSTNHDPATFIDHYKTTDPPTIYSNKLEIEYRKLNKKKIDQYIFKDSNGYDLKLSKFKGKFIYIDIWATWCGPCLIEKNHFKQLKSKFERENIEFVSISIDTNVSKWKKMLEEKSMKGVQLNSKEGFNSKLCKDFFISGIPRFMILDRNGKIVNINAQRPSNHELVSYLRGLLDVEM